MFTCSTLRQITSLGEHLFVVAATIGLATTYRTQWVVPTWSYSSWFRRTARQTSLPMHADFVLDDGRHDGTHDIPLMCLSSDRHIIDLHGAFHHDRYFRDWPEVIRDAFAPREELLAEVRRRYVHILECERTCVVIVKRSRGMRARERLLSAEFYQDAMSRVGNNCTFAMISDDIAWSRDRFPGENVVQVPADDVRGSFVLGILCQDAIVCDTSFSWWVAWLNPSPARRVFAPSPWCQGAEPSSGINCVLPNWTTIDI